MLEQLPAQRQQRLMLLQQLLLRELLQIQVRRVSNLNAFLGDALLRLPPAMGGVFNYCLKRKTGYKRSLYPVFSKVVTAL